MSNDATYRIRRLRWQCSEKSKCDPVLSVPSRERYTASTPFGTMYVQRVGTRCAWGFVFVPYWDEGEHECATVAEGKLAAAHYWSGRLRKALRPARRILEV